MITNELPQSVAADAQATGSQSQRHHQSDISTGYMTGATQNINSGYKKPVSDYYSPKQSPSCGDKLECSDQSDLDSTAPVNLQGVDSQHLDYQELAPDSLGDITGVLDAEAADLQSAELNLKALDDFDTLTHLYQQQKSSASSPTTADIPERVFMNGLIKHTAIALAIIVPLAAFSAYAASPQVLPANTTPASATPASTAANKTTTATIDIEPSAIIHKSATLPTTVDTVDLPQYAGTWYEIGRLPMYFQRKCASDVTATYTEKPDGSGIIVTNKCSDAQGSVMSADGLAKPVDDTGSKLKVTFLPSWIRWLPVGRADYWVLARDADYQTALVGTPDKDYLWLLARSPNITQQTYAKYRQIAQAQGYSLKEFQLTPHSNQSVKLVP